MDQLISVIVPVYQVEPYLRKCLDSIVNQTYANLEIILVDDGSPDSCGAICDEYAAKDARIQVIHQENGGLSRARNAGMELASGTYFGFVDSDDWIDPDMYRCLVEAIREFDAEIAVCGKYLEWGNRQVVVAHPRQEALPRKAALAELLRDDTTQNGVWDKLFRRNLFEGIRFPEGRVYEDIAVMYRLFERSETVAFLSKPKYHYLQRATGSIMATKTMKNAVDYYRANQERYAALSMRYPEYESLLVVECMRGMINVWTAAWLERRLVKKEYRTFMKQCAAFSRTNYRTALRYGTYGITGKLRIFFTQFHAGWAYFVCYLLERAYQWKQHMR